MSKSIIPVIQTFLKGIAQSKRITNTETDGIHLWLFGNKIAEWRGHEIYISDGGYRHSVTTQDRLNMLGAGITLKKGQFYKNGVLWSGQWIKLDSIPEIKEKQKESLWS